jgi:hypothetical protein
MTINNALCMGKVSRGYSGARLGQAYPLQHIAYRYDSTDWLFFLDDFGKFLVPPIQRLQVYSEVNMENLI